METNFKNKNAQEVLNRVLYRLDSYGKYRIAQVCDELSIFDWWDDYLSHTKLNQMRAFLEEAIKLGYTGYVCFKVGASGCSNGMWAHKEESTTGRSPNGDFLYRSFSPDYTYYQIKKGDNILPYGLEYNSIKTMKQLEKFIKIVEG